MFLTCLAPIRGGRRPGNSVGGVMRVWRDEKRWMPRRREVEHAPTRSESRRTTRNVHGRGILAFVGVESAQTAPSSGGSVVGMYDGKRGRASSSTSSLTNSTRRGVWVDSGPKAPDRAVCGVLLIGSHELTRCLGIRDGLGIGMGVRHGVAPVTVNDA